MSVSEMIARLPIDSLGGARVFRPCTIGGELRKGGDVLDAATLASLPRQTLRALVDQRFIVPWPKAAGVAEVPADFEVYVYNRLGTSTYDVVLGKRLHDQPLSKADAEALAAKHRKPVAA